MTFDLTECWTKCGCLFAHTTVPLVHSASITGNCDHPVSSWCLPVRPSTGLILKAYKGASCQQAITSSFSSTHFCSKSTSVLAVGLV